MFLRSCLALVETSSRAGRRRGHRKHTVITGSSMFEGRGAHPNSFDDDGIDVIQRSQAPPAYVPSLSPAQMLLSDIVKSPSLDDAELAMLTALEDHPRQGESVTAQTKAERIHPADLQAALYALCFRFVTQSIPASPANRKAAVAFLSESLSRLPVCPSAGAPGEHRPLLAPRIPPTDVFRDLAPAMAIVDMVMLSGTDPLGRGILADHGTARAVLELSRDHSLPLSPTSVGALMESLQAHLVASSLPSAAADPTPLSPKQTALHALRRSILSQPTSADSLSRSPFSAAPDTTQSERSLVRGGAGEAAATVDDSSSLSTVMKALFAEIVASPWKLGYLRPCSSASDGDPAFAYATVEGEPPALPLSVLLFLYLVTSAAHHDFDPSLRTPSPSGAISIQHILRGVQPLVGLDTWILHHSMITVDREVVARVLAEMPAPIGREDTPIVDTLLGCKNGYIPPHGVNLGEFVSVLRALQFEQLAPAQIRVFLTAVRRFHAPSAPVLPSVLKAVPPLLLYPEEESERLPSSPPPPSNEQKLPTLVSGKAQVTFSSTDGDSQLPSEVRPRGRKGRRLHQTVQSTPQDEVSLSTSFPVDTSDSFDPSTTEASLMSAWKEPIDLVLRYLSSPPNHRHWSSDALEGVHKVALGAAKVCGSLVQLKKALPPHISAALIPFSAGRKAITGVLSATGAAPNFYVVLQALSGILPAPLSPLEILETADGIPEVVEVSTQLKYLRMMADPSLWGGVLGIETEVSMSCMDLPDGWWRHLPFNTMVIDIIAQALVYSGPAGAHQATSLLSTAMEAGLYPSNDTVMTVCGALQAAKQFEPSVHLLVAYAETFIRMDHRRRSAAIAQAHSKSPSGSTQEELLPEWSPPSDLTMSLMLRGLHRMGTPADSVADLLTSLIGKGLPASSKGPECLFREALVYKALGDEENSAAYLSDAENQLENFSPVHLAALYAVSARANATKDASIYLERLLMCREIIPAIVCTRILFLSSLNLQRVLTDRLVAHNADICADVAPLNKDFESRCRLETLLACYKGTVRSASYRGIIHVALAAATQCLQCLDSLRSLASTSASALEYPQYSLDSPIAIGLLKVLSTAMGTSNAPGYVDDDGRSGTVLVDHWIKLLTESGQCDIKAPGFLSAVIQAYAACSAELQVTFYLNAMSTAGLIPTPNALRSASDMWMALGKPAALLYWKLVFGAVRFQPPPPPSTRVPGGSASSPEVSNVL